MNFGDASRPERLHALDTVRGFALLLGVVLHATLSFSPESIQSWIIRDSQPSIAMAALFFAIHVFRMTTFFLIAGFFSRMSFHRRGVWDFVKDRLTRIAVPLVVGWSLLVGAPFLLPGRDRVNSLVAAAPPTGAPMPRWPWPPVLPEFPLGVFWFLYVLLEFYAVALVLCIGFAWLDRTGRIRAQVDRLVELAMRSPLTPGFLAVPIGVAFSLDPDWNVWRGIPAPLASLITNLPACVGYGAAFGFGWLLHRRIDLIRFLEQRWMLNLVPAIGLIAGTLILAMQPPGSDVVRFAAAATYALATWTTTFAVIGVALRFYSGFSATRRYIADSSYWVYLIHLPIVIAMQVAVASLDWPWPVKFTTILLVALTVSLLSYQFLVRYSVIGAVLNGRRVRKVSKAVELI